MRQNELFIGGECGQRRARIERIEVISPHTETPVAQVAAAGPDDVDAAVEAARAAFDTGPWPRLEPAERVDAVRGSRRPTGSGAQRWPS